MTTRIYIAASWTRLEEARKLRTFLRTAGFNIVCRWIDVGGMDYFAGATDMGRWAMVDLMDVLASDVLVCITGDAESRGGRHSEVGMALATAKRVILVGPREQIFHFHPAVRVVATRNELLEVLR